ncbi:MAG: tRNA (N6-isopentenyl adenosine(37)-C2)-methylthiotransferase MiaB [Candidatus Firestonebacteria bacterium]|nr:tRNA (N6-isopentenyl adenosine(37)-C2)-methylthiotransferase MiaB [Candidatus Firestonebacteria bacterium]
MLTASNTIALNNPKVYIKTYGCQMNELDSEIMMGAVKSLGYIAADNYKNADIIILNTCSVRERAVEKIYGHIGELKRQKNNNPNLIIVIAGCLAQEIKGKILKDFPYIDLIIGTLNKKEFPALIKKVINEREKIVSIKEEQEEVYEFDNIERNSNVKAYVSIMEGCNNFCSYCIVPYVRGKEISRQKENILKEIENLAEKGYKEITLLGQNVNSYKDGNCDFADLLSYVHEVAGIERIRFMTSHPKDISDKLIEKAASLRKVCEHFHFPLQSGSNKILENMNRKYSFEKYFETVNYLRKLIPDISITTDFIVGFPGEEEKDFEETLNAVKIIKYDGAFIFRYSQRSGTLATNLPDSVPYKEKIRRLEYLLSVQEEILKEKNSLLINQNVEILVDGRSKKDITQLTGRTRTNKIVVLQEKHKSSDTLKLEHRNQERGEKNLINKIIDVKIIRTGAYMLWGEI